MSAETTVTILTAVAILGYAGAAAAAWKRAKRVALGLFAVSWACNGGIVAVNGWICGEPPFGNMYHVLVFLSLCFLPLYLLLRWRDGLDWLLGHFAAASMLPLVGSVFIERDLVWRRVPALQSGWFVPHVVSYMLSYALATVAFLLTLVALYRVWVGHQRPWQPGRVACVLVDVQLLDQPHCQAGLHILRLGLPFMTFGLVSGALWAEEAWGVYWSWDAKETWSLITWTLYVLSFHCRFSLSTRRWTVVSQLTAFAALLVTFFLVNLLPKLGSVLHSYA